MPRPVWPAGNFKSRDERRVPRTRPSPPVLITVHPVSVFRSRFPPRPAAKFVLTFELDVFPGIGVAGCDCRREYVLPFFGGDPRTDRVDEGVAEDRDEVVILQDLALDLFGERLALGRLVGGQIFVELGVEFAYAYPVGG